MKALAQTAFSCSFVELTRTVEKAIFLISKSTVQNLTLGTLWQHLSKPWDILVPRSLSRPCRQSFCHVSPPEKLDCPWINEWTITLFTAVSRKVVGKNVHATIPKGTMGYNQYTVPWHCSFQTYFRCFPLALGNIRPWPLMPFFQISLKKSELKTTHNTFRDCRVHFCDNLSWNSCIHG